jgi:hypothetical protein
MRYIVSLTSSPGRIDKVLPTLLTIKNQDPPPERIIINLPARYRNSETYPEIATEITDIAHINWIPEDLGPLTKLAPTIDLIPVDEDIYILTIDDDILYMPHTVELYNRMLPILKIPSAMGLSGFVYHSKVIVPMFGVHNVHVIEGYASVLYHRSFFKGAWKTYIDVCLKNSDLKLSDDLIISNWLALQKINRLQVAAPWVNRKLMHEQGSILEYGDKTDALHNTGGGNQQRYARAIKYLTKIKLLDKKEYF